MADDLLTRLDGAAGLGMAVCADAARQIRSLQRKVAELEECSAKSRNDALAIAFERQRQAAVTAKDEIERAIVSQNWGEDADDPEKALKSAAAAIAGIADNAEPEKIGANLLNAARLAPALQTEVDELRIARVVAAGIDPSALRQEGITCSARFDHHTETMLSRHGGVVGLRGEGLAEVTFYGMGHGARTLMTIASALMRPAEQA